MVKGEIVFGRYKILRELKLSEDIGVYLAVHTELESQWIIKTYNKQSHQCGEIDIMRSIRHPQIPLIVDIVEEENRITLIREYVEGQVLSDLIEAEGVVSEELAISLGIGLCNIALYLHEGLDQPIIYRDFTPNNIVITPDKQVCLIDFGIARKYKGNSIGDTQYLGTRGFAAPEQYGIGQSDRRTDVFGIGMTLYYVLTRQTVDQAPFVHPPIRSVRKEVSAILENILIKATEMEPNKRYQDIQDFLSALKGIVKKESCSEIAELMKHHIKQCLFIDGMASGVGTTYTSLVISYMLKHIGRRVAIIDDSRNQGLSELEYMSGNTYKQGTIQVNGLSILGIEHISGNLLTLQTILEDIDILVIDGGNEESEIFTGHMRRDLASYIDVKEVVVTTYSEWQLPSIEDYILASDNENIVYAINLASETCVQAFKDTLPGIKFLQVPYESLELENFNPMKFEYVNELLGEWRWIEACLQIEKNNRYTTFFKANPFIKR